ncbi:MAG: HTTM domain-containing protein [Planctomycetota bacterium]|nr:HTTM domain-containing protein [Planctomycetota bacterium]
MDSAEAPTDQPDTIVKLFGIDLRTLALFRVTVALVLLYNLAMRSADIPSLFTDEGAAPIVTVQNFCAEAWCYSLHFLDGSAEFQVLLFVVSALCAVTLCLGYRSRLSTIGSWILFVSLNNRVPSIITGGDVLLSMALFWGMFLPLGARWSADARRSQIEPANDCELSIATLAVLLQVFWMYWSTGLWKLNEVWLEGRALQVVFTDDMLVRPLGELLLEFPGLLVVLTYIVLVIELAAPFLLFSPWRTNLVRSVTIAVLAGMHVGIELTMTVMIFSFASLAALTLFIPGTWWDRGPLHRVAGRFGRNLRPLRRKPKSRSAAAAAAGPWLPDGILRVVQIFFLIYVPVFNMFSTLGPRRESPGFRAFNRVGELIGATQVWKMFDRPPGENRFVARATFVGGGPAKDILRNERTSDPPRRPETRMALSTARWMLFVRQTARDSARCFRPTLTRYYARRWNDRAAPDQQILELELYFYPSPHESEKLARTGRPLWRMNPAN